MELMFQLAIRTLGKATARGRSSQVTLRAGGRTLRAMNRREALFSVAAAASGLPLVVLAADKAAPAPKSPPPGVSPPAGSIKLPVPQSLVEAAEHCVQTGEECFELALALLKKG